MAEALKIKKSQFLKEGRKVNIVAATWRGELLRNYFNLMFNNIHKDVI